VYQTTAVHPEVLLPGRCRTSRVASNAGSIQKDGDRDDDDRGN
jgi:hypothetical protein